MLKVERTYSMTAEDAFDCSKWHIPIKRGGEGPRVTVVLLSDGTILSIWRRQAVEMSWVDTRNLDLTRLLSVYPLEELVARARPISKTNNKHVCLTIYETHD